MTERLDDAERDALLGEMSELLKRGRELTREFSDTLEKYESARKRFEKLTETIVKPNPEEKRRKAARVP